MDSDFESNFKRGRYTECVTLLKRSNDQKKFHIDEWAREQNLAICRYLKRSQAEVQLQGQGNSHNKTTASLHTVETRETEQSLDRILTQIKGVPADVRTLEIESIIVYNLCYLRLVIQASMVASRSETRPHDLPSDLVLTTLKRVQYYRKDTHSMKSADQTQEICHLVEDILTRPPTGRLQQGVMLLGLIYGLHLMLHRTYLQQAAQVLQTVNKQSESHELAEDLVVLALREDQVPSPKSWCQGAARLLLAAIHYCNAAYSKCIDNLQYDAGTFFTRAESYLKGCAYYKQGEFDQCVRELQSLRGMPDPAVRARALNLTGCCLAKQKLPHNAIQHFKMAVQAHCSQYDAFYNIALQYRELGNHGAELEMLSLLTRALREEVVEICSQSAWLLVDVGDIVCCYAAPAVQCALPNIMYMLASRCRHLGRYKTSAEKYLELLELLSKTQLPGTMRHYSSLEAHVGEISALPRIQTIYHEAAFVLLKCGRYKDAIDVCDKVIDKYTLQNYQRSEKTPQMKWTVSTENEAKTSAAGTESSQTTSNIQTPGANSCVERLKKRQRSEVSQSDVLQEVGEGSVDPAWDSDILRDLEVDVVALKYKADGLTQLGELSATLTCLESVCDVLQPLVRETIGVPGPSAKHAAKKLRLDSDLKCSTLTSENPAANLLVQSCIGCAVVLAGLDQAERALYWSKCALQLQPADLLASYTQCLLLLRLGRPREAGPLWLQTRGLGVHHMDGFQLDQMLHNKIAHRKKNPCSAPTIVGDGPSPDQLVAMDIVALQIAQRVRLR